MATMGQPGKYTFCFAESRAGLLRSFAERRGFGSDEDAVTVLGVSGTAEVLPKGQDTPEQILSPVAAAMWSAQMASGGMRKRDPLEQVFLIPPELVDGLARHGWGLADIQAFLASVRPILRDPAEAPELEDAALCEPADIHPLVTGGPGVKMTHLSLWAGGTRSVTLPLKAL